MNPYQKIQLKPQELHWLRFGEIKPQGWIRAQMQRDLESGFLGRLDELVPDLISKDDIYGANRLSAAVRKKELGVVSKEKEWEIQYLWWNSETQSNWRDGLVRATLLLDQPHYLPKIKAYIEHILASQDADGYLGIYARDLRYNFSSENGELWAQASLFRVLLGYYEATGEARVLEALQRAVNVTMQAYPPGQSNPFTLSKDFAGVGHGLMFTDILDRLYQLTGQQTLLDYALWLYSEYSQNTLSQDDIQVAHLVDPGYRFKAHGAHTYEHLRSLLTSVYASSNPLLEQALQGYLDKLEGCLTPSGGPIGDEFIQARLADAAETGYEYCSIQELLDSYSQLLQKAGAAKWADRLEWLYFNAGQGARHPTESLISYLKTDNSFSMSGSLHLDDAVEPNNPQTRYKYSPAHQDVAVCCVPNAGRITPYYIRAMWMRTDEGLAAMLYGASDLQTEVKGVPVRITQETDYPYGHELRFTLDTAQPVDFVLSFRKPAWAAGFQLACEYAYTEENGMICVRRIWQSGDCITIRFLADIKLNSFSENEFYLSYGPLLFALPLEAEARTGRQYPLDGFQDLYYFPAGSPQANLLFVSSEHFALTRGEFNVRLPWESLSLTGKLLEPSSHQMRTAVLIPISGTILRRVTFGKYG